MMAEADLNGKLLIPVTGGGEIDRVLTIVELLSSGLEAASTMVTGPRGQCMVGAFNGLVK